MPLNLVKADVSLGDVGDKRKISFADMLVEQRQMQNTLIDALNMINDRVETLQQVSEKCEENKVKVDNLLTKTIPELRGKIERDTQLMEARIMKRIDVIEKERLMENAHSRRLNLIINGVPMNTYPEGESEQTEVIVRELMINQLRMQPEYVNGMLLRDVHRLPRPRTTGRRGPPPPPPIIVAFLCQRWRNDCLSNAKYLKDSGISIKSDLPQQLNELRGKMLKEKYRITGARVRLVERTYLPVLQEFNQQTQKWEHIMSFDKNLPLNAALNPVLRRPAWVPAPAIPPVGPPAAAHEDPTLAT